MMSSTISLSTDPEQDRAVKRSVISLLSISVVLMMTSKGSLAQTLHQRIDSSIQAKAGDTPVAPQSSDAEFLRRVYLDFAATIPTAAQTRTFLADKSASKRQAVIDRLLAAPTYATRMEQQFHVMLMERRGDDAAWSKFLQDAFAQNRPWNVMAQQILNPKADDENLRGAAFFITKRLAKYGQNPTDFPGLTRDVGRLFLGLDLQCAECHDHLFIDDYKQVDFKGLFAAYGNTFIRRDVKFPAIGEKEMKAKLEFVSVFDPEQQATGPRLPGGVEFAIPVSTSTVKKPKPKTRPPRPEFSPVKLIAAGVTKPTNSQFAKNAVNRIWFSLIGRGFVEPLDLHHSANPPSHPVLLDLLTQEFVAHKFDVKWLLREIALSDTYQRSGGIQTAKLPNPESFLVAAQRPLTAEQLLQSVLVATGETRLISAPAKTEPESTGDDEVEPALDVAPDYAELKKKFVAAFANDAREPELAVNSTVKGALFWRNELDIQRLIFKRKGNLVDRLMALDDQKAVHEMFVRVLSREAKSDEAILFAQFLATQKDREVAIGDAVWALLTSAEFFTNH